MGEGSHGHRGLAAWANRALRHGRAWQSRVELTNQTTLIHGPLRENSRKPDEFYAFVEKLCPAPRYAYLFSRDSRPNWDMHGDEAQTEAREEALL